MDESYYLRESDIVEENQGEDFYFWLNPDGSLPFPGTRGIIICFVSSVRSSNVYPGLVNFQIWSNPAYIYIYFCFDSIFKIQNRTRQCFCMNYIDLHFSAFYISSNSTGSPIQLVLKFRTICWRSVSGSSRRNFIIQFCQWWW